MWKLEWVHKQIKYHDITDWIKKIFYMYARYAKTGKSFIYA